MLKTLLGILVALSTLYGFYYFNRPILDIYSSRIEEADGSPGFFITYRKEGGQLRTHNLLKVSNNGKTSAENISVSIQMVFEAGDDTPQEQNLFLPTADGHFDLSSGQSTFLQVDGLHETLDQEKIDVWMQKIDSHEARILINGEISYTGSGIFSLFKYKRIFSEDTMKNRSITLYNQD
ncbi:MAG: hypothetical protein Q8Q13_00790 [bacterium]|nr:hypothetical protein [bacterium]